MTSAAHLYTPTLPAAAAAAAAAEPPLYARRCSAHQQSGLGTTAAESGSLTISQHGLWGQQTDAVGAKWRGASSIGLAGRLISIGGVGWGIYWGGWGSGGGGWGGVEFEFLGIL